MWVGGGSSSTTGSFSGSPSRKEREREMRLACSRGMEVTGRLRRGGKGQSPFSCFSECLRASTLLVVPTPLPPAPGRLLLLVDRAEAELWRGPPQYKGGRPLGGSEFWSMDS